MVAVGAVSGVADLQLILGKESEAVYVGDPCGPLHGKVAVF